MIIKRDVYLNRLIDSMDNGLIKIITGIRRCGKSFLLFEIFYPYLISHNIDDSHIIKIALDDRDNKDLRNPDKLLKYIKDSIIDKRKYFILLDEIQLVDEFEDVLNSLLHLNNVDVYVTGSNSKFLSKDIITEFRGRGDEIHIMPLSFSEFVPTYNGTKEEAFNEYMLHGGMPLVLSYSKDDKKEEYLKRLFSMTYISDIVEKNQIQSPSKLDNLIRVLASSIGSLVNSSKIADTLRSVEDKTMTNVTIDNYLEYLEDSFIIRKSTRYDIKGRKNIGATKKYYFTDIGLRNATLDFLQSDYGHVMENIIYNELIYRGYSVNIGVVTLNTKNKEGTSARVQFEVDFIASRGSKKYYIQSAYQINNEEKLLAEKRSLININDSFKKIIIVRDSIKVLHDEYGISTIGIVEFLANIDSLEL